MRIGFGAQRTFIYVQCYCRRVVRASVAMKRDAPEHSRGYGFVVFERARDAAAAQRALNGSVLAGREVKVSLSQSYNA